MAASLIGPVLNGVAR